MRQNLRQRRDTLLALLASLADTAEEDRITRTLANASGIRFDFTVGALNTLEREGRVIRKDLMIDGNPHLSWALADPAQVQSEDVA